ncbi:MAG: VOC family protein [Nitrospinales bacterium]
MFQKIAYTCYPVRDMARAVDFYRDVLGLKPLFTGDEWSEFEIGGQRLALRKMASPASTVAAVSLEATPIEHAVEKLKSRGVRIARDVQVFPYGKLASFLDSEGNLVGLYEPPAKPSNR